MEKIENQSKTEHLDNDLIFSFTRIEQYQLSPLILKNSLGRFGIVRLGVRDGKHYALKIFKRAPQQPSQVNCLTHLNQQPHPNILRSIAYLPNARCYSSILPNPVLKPVLVLQRIEGVELFELLSLGRFSQDMAWYFFKQLIEGLEVIHGRGYVHHDIKLENLMVSFEGNRGEVPVLKIIDFGKAARLDGNIQMEEGTMYTNDPCFYNSDLEYVPQKADIYAAAVVLLRMMTMQKVYQKAWMFDSNYKLIIHQKWDQFWQAVSKQLTKQSQLSSSSTISQPLKNLLQNLLQPDSSLRHTIPQILLHPWLHHPKSPNLQSLLTLTSQSHCKLITQGYETPLRYSPSLSLQNLFVLNKYDMPDAVTDYKCLELVERLRRVLLEEGRAKVGKVVLWEEGRRARIQVELQGQQQGKIEMHLYRNYDGRLAICFTRGRECEPLVFYQLKREITKFI